MLEEAGCEDKQIAFLIDEEKLSDDKKVSDISQLLNNGEISDLFAIEDRGRIVE
jgi:hypothetical protein